MQRGFLPRAASSPPPYYRLAIVPRTWSALLASAAASLSVSSTSTPRPAFAHLPDSPSSPPRGGFAQLAGNAQEDPFLAVFALQVRRRGEDAPLVLNDRFGHLHGRGRRRVVGAPRLEVADDLGPAVAGACDQGFEAVGRDEARDGDAAHRRVGHQRHHCVAVPAQHHRLDVLDAHVQLHRDEGAEAGRVEHPRHPDHPLPREPGRFLGHVGHHVEGVGHHNHDRVRRHTGDLLADRADDPGVGPEQVVTAHARLARDPRRHDEEVGPLGGTVVVRTRHPRVEAFHRGALPLVEPLPLGDAFHDVDEDDFLAQLLLGKALGAYFAHMPGTNYGDLPGHQRFSRRFRV